MIKRFRQNIDGRDFVVGDIHGELDLFNEKLQEISFDSSVDRMFSVGDLVDRGPKSFECLLLLENEWFHSVMGNHELMMMDAIIDETAYGQKIQHHVHNGGEWMLNIDQEKIRRCFEYAKNLPLVFEVETLSGLIGITHADPAVDDWSKLHEEPFAYEHDVLWSRSKISHNDSFIIKNIFMTYHGHTPLQSTKQLGNSRFIDTGAVFGNRLTIEELGIVS